MQVDKKRSHVIIDEKFIAVTKNDFPSKLDNVINNIIIKEGYLTYDINKRTITTDGGNYLGILYAIDVKGETNEGGKETNIFVKTIVPGEDKMKILSIPRAYETELFAYKELSKIYNELQDEANIVPEDRFEMVKSFEESNQEAIVLENVTAKGYKTHYRKDVVTLQYAELAVRQLAKFHSLSFALQERKPEYFETKIKTMRNAFNFGRDWNELLESMVNLTMNYLDDNLKLKMEKVLPVVLGKYAEYIEDNSTKICLCHGDYRPNNIMMKEINGEVSDLIPVDYQLLHYGCPVYDFLYFIYTSTDKKFRRDHLLHLKNEYYQTLGRFLGNFDICLEIVYPREAFDRLFREKLDFGLMVTVIFGPFMFVDENNVPDVTKESMANMTFQLDDRYRDILREVIEDYIE